MTLLAIATLAVAQKNYVIDSVCVGADRYYRIDGQKGSSYDWHLTDTVSGSEFPVSYPEGNHFTDVVSPGDTVWGSEIPVFWTDIGIFRLYTYHFSEFGCDTVEQGLVKVFDSPEAIAGDDQIACLAIPVILSGDSAWNYSSVEWISSGDGTFDDNHRLHPVYYAGTADSISGAVTLILNAYGLAENLSCLAATDSVTIQFSNPDIVFDVSHLLCYNDSSGAIKADVTNGLPPYNFEWKGPGGFTASGDSVSNLAAGIYAVTLTDASGCVVTDSVEITQPDELLADIEDIPPTICLGDSVLLNAIASGGTGNVTHLWTGTGAAFLDDVQNPATVLRGDFAGINTLVYSVTDENGCSATDTITIEILSPTASVTDTSICASELPLVWNDSTYVDFGSYVNINSEFGWL